MRGNRLEIRSSFKTRALGTVAGWILRGYCATLRLRATDEAGLRELSGKRRLIYCLWHNGIFVAPAAWRRICRRDYNPTAVMTSASHDGEVLARAVGAFGLDAVRGSSHRRAVAGLIAMRKALESGTDACLTPDGPRGPRYVCQPGVVKLAELTGALLIPMQVTFHSAWILKTWDRFRVPKPFSRVDVIFGRTLEIPAGLKEDEFNERVSELETILRRGVNDLAENFPEKQ